LLGKVAAKAVNIRLNLALLFTASVIPDIDLFLISFLDHRGPTHSLFFSFVVLLPFFLRYKKKAIPYFVALLSHSLIGDIYFSGIQLFWPFSSGWIHLLNFTTRSGISVILELTLFVVGIVVMLLNKDFQNLLLSREKRIYWLIPLGVVLVPLFVGSINPDYYLPRLLVIPSLFYIVVFSFSIINVKYKKN
jgi:membrane-bound metal-dependent hydrolase YbcI (DUF457 family)